MKREEKSRLTKEKLFMVAVELINEKGYEAVTVSEICKKAGVAKGTFYVHFESKDDIIKANYYGDMSKYLFENLDKYILNKYKRFNLSNESTSIKERIKYFIKLEFSYAEKVGYKITARALITNLTDCINERESNFDKREFSEPLRNLIKEGIRNNEFKEDKTVEEIFTLIDSFIRGIVLQWSLSKGDLNIFNIGIKVLNERIDEL